MAEKGIDIRPTDVIVVGGLAYVLWLWFNKDKVAFRWPWAGSLSRHSQLGSRSIGVSKFGMRALPGRSDMGVSFGGRVSFDLDVHHAHAVAAGDLQLETLADGAG